jgi:hypothetical protein
MESRTKLFQLQTFLYQANKIFFTVIIRILYSIYNFLINKNVFRSLEIAKVLSFIFILKKKDLLMRNF